MFTGVRISGYVVKNNGTDWVELGSRSPQDPQVNATFLIFIFIFVVQAFYPVTNNVTVNPGDYLVSYCRAVLLHLFICLSVC